MIDRNDMLELTRRLTPERSSVGRIAGAYFDAEGYVDGTFNINFLKLSVPERKKNLSIAKTVLFSETIYAYQRSQTAGRIVAAFKRH